MTSSSQHRRLGVNIDHVATIRQARGTPYPDLALAAHIAEGAGADQITCHLREDRRHIQDKDLLNLRKMVKTKLNLEMAATAQMLEIALATKPDIVTLVPEKRQELTTEGGLELFASDSFVSECIKKLKQGGIPVSLFINPELADVEKSLELGANAIELHTGQYAEALGEEAQLELRRIAAASERGAKLQLKVFAGHGLHYENVLPLVKIAEIEEYNIGHSIVARAIFVGLDEAVKEMKALLVSR